MKKYTQEHEWLESTDDAKVFKVGITNYAQDQLGDVITVELPSIGDEVTGGDACAVIESVKSASNIYAPISGTIKSVNDTLNDNPELVNSSAESEAWLFEIETTAEVNLDGFMDEQTYSSTLES